MWTVNNGFALSKMLLPYHFEVLSDFNYIFLANMFYLRYEKPEERPQKYMLIRGHRYMLILGQSLNLDAKSILLWTLKYRVIVPKVAQCTL